MRRAGWVLTILGALLVVLGAVVAVILGPDSRFTTGPHPVDTSGTVVVTQPGVISWRGVQVDVLVEVPVNKPVFVGLGNSVDVQDYVQRTERVEVTRFSTPWEPETRTVEGQEGLPGAATALDWWITDSAGLGGASISTTLPDETVSLAIVAVGATNLSGLEVTLAYGVKGGFAGALATVVLGVGLVLAGHALRRGQGLFVEGPQEDVEVVEEIVYVYVDEDGVEHEITAEEAAALQEQEPVQDDAASPAAIGPDPAADQVDPGPDADAVATETSASPERPETSGSSDHPVREQQRLPPRPGVVTAADILREATEESRAVDATPEDTAPEDTAPEDGRLGDREDVVYVFVDEDGVEHEVSADELDDYEVVDDEEES